MLFLFSKNIAYLWQSTKCLWWEKMATWVYKVIRQQAIVWTNAEPIHWHIYAAIRGVVLILAVKVKRSILSVQRWFISLWRRGTTGQNIIQRTFVNIQRWQCAYSNENRYFSFTNKIKRLTFDMICENISASEKICNLYPIHRIIFIHG